MGNEATSESASRPTKDDRKEQIKSPKKVKPRPKSPQVAPVEEEKMQAVVVKDAKLPK